MQNQGSDLQEKVDKVKAIGLLNNIHNLSPPIAKSNDAENSIAVINSLKVTPRLIEVFLEIMGLMYIEEQKKYIQVSKPIMNLNGAFRFIKIVKHISEEIEWSNFKEDEIDARILKYFETIYPSFTFYHEDYDLDPADFAYIESTLMTFIDSSFHKSKSAKYLNVVGKTYSEDFLAKAVGDGSKTSIPIESPLSKLNPWRKKR